MTIEKKIVVDENGRPTSVMIDYELFQKLEVILLDIGLAKAMEEADNDEELDLESALKEIKIKM
ncbi:MAG: antitoxin [Bacteroidetes bacterium]|nr:antitoxin [Bacteroidota bacterium]MBU2585756.1 antitoxin [Bacteroidota bacterium]